MATTLLAAHDLALPRARGVQRLLLAGSALAWAAGCTGTPLPPADPPDLATPGTDAALAADAASARDAASAPDLAQTPDMAATLPGWRLVFSDEFNGPQGAAADPSRWVQETGGNGWGNNEREYYTSGTGNAYQSAGSLVIEVKKETPAGSTCWYGACQYSSARLITRGKLSQQFGRFEARIKLPAGQGLWPAFWMLGDNLDTAGWPACGEIDIMENIGREPATNHGSLHGPGYSGASSLTASYDLPSGRLSDGFHVFAVEWEQTAIRFYVDGNLYETRTPKDVPAGARWVFDHPFFLLLNVAVGGSWPGDPDVTTVFPQRMLVDYVRVYQR